MDVKALQVGFVLYRLAVGLVFLLAPTFGARGWLGGEGDRLRALGRSIGVRDVVLSGAALGAALRERSPRPWLAATATGETADAAALWLARRLPARRRLLASGGPAMLALVALHLARRSGPPGG